MWRAGGGGGILMTSLRWLRGLCMGFKLVFGITFRFWRVSYMAFHACRAYRHLGCGSLQGLGTRESLRLRASVILALPKGSCVVPFWGSILESPITNPKRNYIGAFG